MKQFAKLNITMSAMAVIVLQFLSCYSTVRFDTPKTDSVEANIKMYTHVWDEIINKGRFDMFSGPNAGKPACTAKYN
jgi:hypothetical protein